MSQQPARWHRHRLAVWPHEHRQGRDGADIIGDQIGSGKNRLDTGHVPCRFGVNRNDFRVGMRRAQHMQP